MWFRVPGALDLGVATATADRQLDGSEGFCPWRIPLPTSQCMLPDDSLPALIVQVSNPFQAVSPWTMATKECNRRALNFVDDDVLNGKQSTIDPSVRSVRMGRRKI